jgi:hypothetical protein
MHISFDKLTTNGFPLQDEKNQILTTNAWLNLVSSVQTRGCSCSGESSVHTRPDESFPFVGISENVNLLLNATQRATGFL